MFCGQFCEQIMPFFSYSQLSALCPLQFAYDILLFVILY